MDALMGDLKGDSVLELVHVLLVLGTYVQGMMHLMLISRLDVRRRQ